MSGKHKHFPSLISMDAGFTLIYPSPKVGDAYAAIGARFGYQLDGEAIHRRFLSSWKRRTAENRANDDANAFTDEGRSYSWWREVFVESMGDLLKNDDDIDRVFRACFEEYALGTYWRSYPEVALVLTELKKRGTRMVVLSNWDRRLHRTLADLDLGKFFTRIYISTETGFAKPQAGAFARVLSDFNLPPEEVLHVGDSIEDDCFGARNAGMETLLLDRNGDREDEFPGIPIIRSLAEILAE